jgi:hypothetical protein
MSNTLWEIEEKSEEENPESILSILLDKKANLEYINYIKNYDVNQIKTILDDYITSKNIDVIPSKEYDFKLISYEMNGSEDIKYALDYKNYEYKCDPFIDYDIKIFYMCNSYYKLCIKQESNIINNDHNTIDNVFDFIIKTIKQRSAQRKINLTMA